jgi:predicted secreted protein
MTMATAAASFFLMWWVVLFAVLPWGVHNQSESDDMTPGTDPGAPALPRLGRKLLWTTIVTIVIYGVCYVVYVNHLVTLQDLLAPFGLH